MTANNQPVVGAIIFSMVDETVWASWPTDDAPVQLGHCDAVIYMMRDFLAQCDLGERLDRHKAGNG